MENKIIFGSINLLLSLALAPLLVGVVDRMKVKFGGRHGSPFLQIYYNIFKLLKKGFTAPENSTAIFYLSPIINLAAIIIALTMLPFGGTTALFAFEGDFILIVYLFAVARFVTMLGALDTGSAFEGMGASREATFSAISEPILFLSFLPLGFLASSFSLTSMVSPIYGANWVEHWPILVLLSIAFLLIVLVENCRIPVDDPSTHLELTMIHEAMILDHGGVDLAFIEYASALKHWFFAALVSNIILPPIDNYLLSLFAGLSGVLVVTVFIAVVESVIARLRLLRVPQILSIAGSFSVLACVLCIYNIWR